MPGTFLHLILDSTNDSRTSLPYCRKPHLICKRSRPWIPLRKHLAACRTVFTILEVVMPLQSTVSSRTELSFCTCSMSSLSFSGVAPSAESTVAIRSRTFAMTAPYWALHPPLLFPLVRLVRFSLSVLTTVDALATASPMANNISAWMHSTSGWFAGPGPLLVLCCIRLKF